MSCEQATTSQIRFGGININLEFYNGPLDLLLHLVKKKEIPIQEVKLSEIVDEYLAIISNTESLDRIDLDDASEYLVIAANLIAYKSKILLPSQKDAQLDLDLEEGGNEGLEELRRRLIEYAIAKEDAERLMLMPQVGIDYFHRQTSSDLNEIEGVERSLADGQDSFDLARKYFKLLERIGKSKNSFKISLEPLATSYVVRSVMDFFKINKTNKSSLFYLASGFVASISTKLGISSKSEKDQGEYHFAVKNAIVSTFCAILELANKRTVKIEKDGKDLKITSNIIMDYDGDDLEDDKIDDKQVVNQ